MLRGALAKKGEPEGSRFVHLPTDQYSLGVYRVRYGHFVKTRQILVRGVPG
jgi:hypothetical protein